ncbi:MAG: Methyltransferase domain [Betaproteobacteria bacterium]|jgi:SAM-dependent methyltransferase|nr:Methyltransferase domain [Betaproteobacteria bacterium]
MRQAPVIRSDGWSRRNIWEHSATVRELYRKRARREAEEMTCHRQAAELLAPLAAAGESLLDAGCGSGYFYHSLAKQGLKLDYYGIDATDSLVDVGREELPAFGLPAERLRTLRIEDLDAEVDHVVCINVLSNIDNFHRPLERLLAAAGKSVILRESLADKAGYEYVVDRFLDPGCELRVHVNTYALGDVVPFVQSQGFETSVVQDRHTGGEPELVIGYPHHWKFLVCRRTAARRS